MRTKRSKKAIAPVPSISGPEIQNFPCEFCKKSFSKELPFINHSCEKKRRWYAKDEPASRLALAVWSRFYEISMGYRGVKLKKSYREFIDSSYYISFIKFARHIIDINAIDSKRFIDYVIKANIPLDKWSEDFVYDQYVRDLTKKETSEEALERSILLMQHWSIEHHENWWDFFRKISPGQAILWLKTGRISPWVLYNVNSAETLFERCTAEQLSMIKEFAPIAQWKIKFSRNAEAVTFLRNALKDFGL